MYVVMLMTWWNTKGPGEELLNTALGQEEGLPRKVTPVLREDHLGVMWGSGRQGRSR